MDTQNLIESIVQRQNVDVETYKKIIQLENKFETITLIMLFGIAICILLLILTNVRIVKLQDMIEKKKDQQKGE